MLHLARFFTAGDGAMILSPAQEEAVRAIVAWYRSGQQEFYVAGYAGTGKTTLVDFALQELRAHHGMTSVAVGAYTGKAAHVLRKKGNPGAATLHSLAYAVVPGSDPVRFTLAWESDLRYADLLVVDEVSLVSDEMADDLRKLARRILVIGDPGQLPPVHGAGAFTRREPDVFLTEIHRQAMDHPILRLATMAREGKPITPADAAPGARVEYVRAWDQLEEARGGQIIVGRHRTRFSVTRHLRQLRGYRDPVPELDEPLICRQNNRELGIFNGQEAQLVWAIPDDEYLRLAVLTEVGNELEVTVPAHDFREHYTGRATPPRRERGIERFDWAYALTCHSAQGSEWPSITVVDDSDAFREDAHRWLYTALTRASDDLTLLLRR